MEVHHHSHTSRPPAERAGKKWTHYFWEFLMLFLAVFCGFLAENQREHMIENQREKKFAKRLLSDLREDSAFCKKMVLQSEERKIIHEQFLKIMATAEKSTDSTVLSYFRSLIGRGFSSELLNATFNQMKASGSLRYIRNDELTNALQKYYDVRLPKTSRVPDEMRQFFNDHIVPYMIRHFRFQDLNYIDDSSAHIQHVILDRSTRSDQELVNLLGIRNAAFETALAGYKETLRQANNLITLIKKEYHLK